MVTLLAKIFIKDSEDKIKQREAYGMLCGVIGILFNVLLFIGKFLAGTLSNSIAITADAFNNLSDAGSSIVTLLGFKLAGAKPDTEHPFGHGRIEYVSGLVVAAAILLMGYELVRDSIGKIMHPEETEFTLLVAVILIASILVKLAVTGCPTGIAHTYMAAEALEKKAKELGYRIKVETRGSGGAKNVLTKAEIAEAECIIVAADTQVPMDRFAGKPVIQCKVADGISKAEELLTKAANGHASIYEAGGKAADDEEEGKDSLGHQIYKHLMNGVSHMLPFVVGGGILIAIAFLIDGFSVDLNSLPLDQRSNFGTITPMAAMFKSIGGVAFGFMLPILAGFIAMSIADRPGLAVGFVGGAIAANGTSGFLGALVAGFLAGYVVLLLKKICSKLPDSLEGTKPVLIYPLFGIFIVGVLMTYVVEPPIGALNTLINNGLNGLNGASAILLGALLGGMMSVDMGGPVNKAAYVFGTASIAAGNYNIMAAVMVGGMVPPIAIALATLIFKNKFTEDERKAGPTNFIMGFSFITEGAIPFAASDPLHVLPACVVGSAVAGALSMAFNCTLMAPHGGIFVFLTVGNPLLYLVALAVGSAVGCVLLGVLKKKQLKRREKQ